MCKYIKESPFWIVTKFRKGISNACSELSASVVWNHDNYGSILRPLCPGSPGCFLGIGFPRFMLLAPRKSPRGLQHSSSPG